MSYIKSNNSSVSKVTCEYNGSTITGISRTKVCHFPDYIPKRNNDCTLDDIKKHEEYQAIKERRELKLAQEIAMKNSELDAMIKTRKAKKTYFSYNDKPTVKKHLSSHKNSGHVNVICIPMPQEVINKLHSNFIKDHSELLPKRKYYVDCPIYFALNGNTTNYTDYIFGYINRIILKDDIYTMAIRVCVNIKTYNWLKSSHKHWKLTIDDNNNLYISAERIKTTSDMYNPLNNRLYTEAESEELTILNNKLEDSKENLEYHQNMSNELSSKIDEISKSDVPFIKSKEEYKKLKFDYNSAITSIKYREKIIATTLAKIEEFHKTHMDAPSADKQWITIWKVKP